MEGVSGQLRSCHRCWYSSMHGMNSKRIIIVIIMANAFAAATSAVAAASFVHVATSSMGRRLTNNKSSWIRSRDICCCSCFAAPRALLPRAVTWSTRVPARRRQWWLPPLGTSIIRGVSTTTSTSSSKNEDLDPCDARSSTSRSSMTDAERNMTRDARRMVDAAIRAVDPVTAVRAHLQVQLPNNNNNNSSILTVLGGNNGGDDHDVPSEQSYYDLCDYDRILVVAFGKASASMACAVVEQLAPVLDDNNNNNLPPPAALAGLIICKDGHVSQQEGEFLQQHNITVREASHPVPDQRSVVASQELLDLVAPSSSMMASSSNSPRTTLLLACISGGGSALFCAPRPPLTLQDLQDVNTVLLQSGWRIQDMNVLRQCLELGKGGGLALLAGESTTIVSLILSDILGDPLDLIASGPTVVTSKSQKKYTTAWNLLQQDGNTRMQLPIAVLEVVRKGFEQEQSLSESISSSDVSANEHKKYQHCLVGNNARAVQAAAQQAEALGYHPIVLTTQLQGEASTVAQVLVGLAHHVRQGPLAFSLVSPKHFPVALIAGGETTVTLPSGLSFVGKGGRNQELALAAALALQTLQLRQVVVASVGTDGTDGPTDAAGGIVDGGTVERLLAVEEHDDDCKLSATQALRQHNAYPYLNRCDCEGVSPLVKTGPTGTNVADICVILVYDREKDSL